MTWDLATAKTYLEIVGTAQDTLLTRVMDETLVAIESALGRGLLLATDTEVFRWVNGPRLLLRRFPLVSVTTITGPVAGPTYDLANVKINADVGTIESFQFYGSTELTVEYEGGYDPLPADLERAMWSAFLTLWAATDGTTGAPAIGSGAVIVPGSGEVSSVSLADFGTVRFDVGSSVSSGDSSSAALVANWGWLYPWASTLQLYRAGQAGIGLGVV